MPTVPGGPKAPTGFRVWGAGLSNPFTLFMESIAYYYTSFYQVHELYRAELGLSRESRKWLNLTSKNFCVIHSAVSALNRLLAGRARQITIRFLIGPRDFSLFQIFQAGHGAHPTTFSSVPRALSPAKVVWAWNWKFAPLSTHVTNKLPQHASHVALQT